MTDSDIQGRMLTDVLLDPGRRLMDEFPRRMSEESSYIQSCIFDPGGKGSRYLPFGRSVLCCIDAEFRNSSRVWREKKIKFVIKILQNEPKSENEVQNAALEWCRSAHMG